MASPRPDRFVWPLLCLSCAWLIASWDTGAPGRRTPASARSHAAPIVTTARSAAADPVDTKPRRTGGAQQATLAPGNAGRVFALLDPGETATSAARFASMPQVDGLAYRAPWSRLETSPGRYDWNTLDAIADVARAGGKRLTLHVAPDLPAWLAPLGAQTYTYSSPIGSGTAAVPWDSVYLDRIERFAVALAEHVRARGDADLLAVVSVGAPVPEMSLVGCLDGSLGSGITYDRTRYLDAWRTAIVAYDNAFSDAAYAGLRIVVSAPVAEICRPDGDGAAFFTALTTDLPRTVPRIGAFMADLNAPGSQRLGQVGASMRTSLHFQTIWSYTDDPNRRFGGPLQDAVCHARRAGGRYLELYKADLLNPDPVVQNAIANARSGDGC